MLTVVLSNLKVKERVRMLVIFILSFLLGISLMGNWLQFVYHRAYAKHLKKRIDEAIIVKVKKATGVKL